MPATKTIARGLNAASDKISKKTVVRVHDVKLIDEMADLVDSRKSAARIAVGCKAASAEAVALHKTAELVEVVKEMGYSQVAAEGLINQGAARSSRRASIVNGATGSDKPTLPIAHVKFDGKGQGRRIDRQRRRIGREADLAVSFWEGATEGIQDASLKADAADTGEWFG